MDAPQKVVDGNDDDDYDDIPLQYQRPFGSGLHKKAIAFIPASGDGRLNSTNSTISAATAKPRPDVADLYLSMVLPTDTKPRTSTGQSAGSRNPTTEPPIQVCEVCNLPLASLVPPAMRADEGPSRTATAHENSFAHQVCLPHSHPPSALDRSRMGLSYLSSHGWDPDARKGLGAAQQGIQYPIKPKGKEDKLGLGLAVPKNLPPKKEKAKTLDAGRVRKLVAKEKRRGERIRQQLFGRGQDLEKYLGPGAAG
ncbi:hypothetical protein B0T25DRAFT_198815 [Lasiosphaeria hispida]|uniref:G-patch domain-containing protein n=1 Tax=Lasiosphaeria hispida TaxID=260671 RepID=A0AAJ0MEB6_9PEZI|nr:hypothetical protein B0T25DRAFT_198815 [Lasiosphaeria hispida]